MQKAAFLFALVCCSLLSRAQSIRFGSDAQPIVKQIESTTSVKHYNKTYDTTYNLVLTTDSVNNALLKATVQDNRSRSTRTYYFHNGYLIKVTERFERPSPISLTHHVFLDTDYYLMVNYKDDLQKEVLVRQRLLVDGYKFLLYYQQISRM